MAKKPKAGESPPSPEPVTRHRRKITVTLADETFAAIEARLVDNPGLRTISAAIDDLILRPNPPSQTPKTKDPNP